LKGLIIKEFYDEGKSMIIVNISVALLIIALSFTPITELMLFFLWPLISIVTMYPTFSIFADAQKGFHICAETLPVSKDQIIISKFKVSWILAFFSAIIGFVGIMIHFLFYGGANIAEELRSVLFILAVGVVFSSVFQIFMIKKVKPGSLMPALYGGMGYTVSMTAYEIFLMFEKQGMILLICGIFAIATYIFSYFKCIDIYKKGVIQ